jgi:hypothetical protein
LLSPAPPQLPRTGKRVVNLLGSNGTRAVALALLGAARVAVVDVSPGNAAWGAALAGAAGVGGVVEYVVGDALELTPVQEAAAGAADVALAELGVRPPGRAGRGAGPGQPRGAGLCGGRLPGLAGPPAAP